LSQIQYSPGHVLIFLAGQVYHHVEEWKPALAPPGNPLTPGRIGNVFFFPQATYEKLKGRPFMWNNLTMSGTSADVSL
jgi:hypothetical protein